MSYNIKEKKPKKNLCKILMMDIAVWKIHS